MSFCWSNIPQHLFKIIINNFQFQEFKPLLLICHNWNAEIHAIKSKDIALKCSDVDTTIKKTYTNIKINWNVKEDVLLNLTNVNYLDIKVKTIKEFLKIIGTLGNPLQYLKVELLEFDEQFNDTPDANVMRILSTVKVLYIADYPSCNFFKLIKYFKILRTLTIIDGKLL